MKQSSKMGLLLPFLFLIVFSPFVESKEDIYEVSNELMCPVCQGQTVAESNSELALSMREVIKNKLNKGESKEEILSYFVNLYGESILSKPPIKGINIFLWLAPPIILIISIVFWVIRVRNNKRKTR